MKILWHMMTKCTHFFPVSVEYPFFIDPLFRLSSSCVLCCQFFWNVNFWLPLRFVYLRLVYPMLSVVLECPFLIVPSFRLSSSGCQFFWSVHFFIAPSVFSNVYLCATEKHMYFVHIVKCWLYVISAHTLIL